MAPILRPIAYPVMTTRMTRAKVAPTAIDAMLVPSASLSFLHTCARKRKMQAISVEDRSHKYQHKQ